MLVLTDANAWIARPKVASGKASEETGMCKNVCRFEKWESTICSADGLDRECRRLGTFSTTILRALDFYQFCTRKPMIVFRKKESWRRKPFFRDTTASFVTRNIQEWHAWPGRSRCNAPMLTRWHFWKRSSQSLPETTTWQYLRPKSTTDWLLLNWCCRSHTFQSKVPQPISHSTAAITVNVDFPN